MTTPWNYKGYLGMATVDAEANVIRGKVINTKDTITFEGTTVGEAKSAFEASVEDYLEFCASLGEPPEKPFSGRVLVPIQPELHRDLSLAAQIKGVSFNKFVAQALKKVAIKSRSLKMTSRRKAKTAPQKADADTNNE